MAPTLLAASLADVTAPEAIAVAPTLFAASLVAVIAPVASLAEVIEFAGREPSTLRFVRPEPLPEMGPETVSGPFITASSSTMSSPTAAPREEKL